MALEPAERDKTSASATALRQALQAYGSVKHLAAYLGVDHVDLERWIAGEEIPPHDIFVKALGLALNGLPEHAKIAILKETDLRKKFRP